MADTSSGLSKNSKLSRNNSSMSIGNGSGSGYLLFADKKRPSILVQDGDEVELVVGQGKEWKASVVHKHSDKGDKDEKDDTDNDAREQQWEWCLRLERVECKDDREERKMLCIANHREELARRKEEIEALKKDVEALNDRCAEVRACVYRVCCSCCCC